MVRRGVLFGLCLVVLLTAAAFLLIPRGGDRPGPVAPHLRPPAVAADRPTQPPAPSFDIVTVAPDGTAVIAGRAAPRSRVQVFDGDKKLGEAVADRRGEWVLLPDRPLAAGARRLKLRATTATGVIVASAETVAVAVPRAARQSPPAPPARPNAAPPSAAHAYVVQRGNTLWRIARHFFGTGLRYLQIYSANLGQIHNPDLIYPGQVVKLPQS